MTAADLVDKLLADEYADVLRDSVAWLVAELMEAEVGGLTGAGLGERAPDRRQAQRNGYRPRRWDTRVGELELAIPRLRTGSYFPSFLEPRRRAEQAENLTNGPAGLWLKRPSTNDPETSLRGRPTTKTGL